MIKKLYDKTAGYKTYSASLLLAAYELVKVISPGLMSGKVDQITGTTINFLIITGAFDWIYRNRENIVNTIKSKIWPTS